MKPALSVVAFTVLSGAGLGALALLALYDIAVTLGVPTSTASGVFFGRGAVTALAFVVAGLGSSTLHLANPRNAWRSLTRWRTSWLSREALAALVLLPVAAIWIAALHFGLATGVRASAAAATVGLAWATLYCTSMIYASLVPIRQWHTRRVPVAYFALGHASGALIVVGIASSHGEQASVLAALAGVLLAVAALVKLEYYTYIASDRDRVTLEQAIGVPDGVRPGRAAAKGSIMRARLLDVGHSRGTFLTHEFLYSLAPERRTALRLLFWVAGVAIPGIWLAYGSREWPGAVAACATCLAGIGAERWLFFAEARHTVRLYHGDRTT